MNLRFDHLCLTVSDLDRSIDFYGRYFGLQAVRRDPVHSGEMVDRMTGVDGGSLFAAFLTDGRFILELIQFAGKAPVVSARPDASSIGCPHLGYSVPDVRAVWRQWRGEGVRFTGEPLQSKRHHTWTAMMYDPDGVMIELREGSALPAVAMTQAAPEQLT